jgi:hypothetical protein
MWKKHLLYVAYAFVLIGVLPAAAAETVRIAFSSSRDGNAEIDAMNRDGTGQNRQTVNTTFDGHPAWGKVIPVSTPAPTPPSGCTLQDHPTAITPEQNFRISERKRNLR